MTNTKLLKEKIDASGLKFSFIAGELGITRQGFWKKLNNMSSFNQEEIAILCKCLHITALREKEAIFFANDVD